MGQIAKFSEPGEMPSYESPILDNGEKYGKIISTVNLDDPDLLDIAVNEIENNLTYTLCSFSVSAKELEEILKYHKKFKNF